MREYQSNSCKLARMSSMKKSLTRLEAVARFKAMRLERKESADQFGALVGVSGSTVHRWENPDSDSNPDSRKLLQICMRCDISPTWLLFGLGVNRLSDIPGLVQDVEQAKDRKGMAKRIADAAAALEKLELAIKRIELKSTA